MPLTSFATNLVLDALWRGQALPAPATLYVALVTTAGPTNALAGIEVVGGAYARVAIKSALASWSGTQAAGSTAVSSGLTGVISNNAIVSFPQPSDNWGAVVGFELWDAPTFGQRWFFANLTVPKTVSAGDPSVTFPVGQLGLSVV
jgi:hypothetical protein